MEFTFPEFSEPIRLILLAVIQGIAEFLPISSSGHLNVFADWFGGEPSTLVNIALHFGTLGSIVVYYRKSIAALLGQDRRVIPLLIVGTLPAVLGGLLLKKLAPELLEDLMLTGVMLAITGIALCFFQPRRKKTNKQESGHADDSEQSGAPRERIEYTSMSWKVALLIGCFQAFALMPGISRSGFTILAGILFGLKHKSAATWSFLLAIPAIAGATSLEFVDLIITGTNEPIGMVLVAMLIAFFVGLVSLALLVKLLDLGKLHWFAMWVLPLGLIVIIQQIYVYLDQSYPL